MLSKLLTFALMIGIVTGAMSQTGSPTNSRAALPAGYWPLEKSQPIIGKTETIKLGPDLLQLSEGERRAVAKLLEVGKIFQSLFEQQRHSQALTAYQKLVQLDTRTGSGVATQNLLTLYRLNQGPIATTLDNKREAFLPVDEVKPGKNVYPWDVKKEELDAFLSAHPEQRDDILDLRTVVRKRTAENIQEDLATLRNYPALDTLHPGLRQELESISLESAEASKSSKSKVQSPTPRTDPILDKKTSDVGLGTLGSGFYAVPYAVAYAEELIRAYGLLNDAANAVAKDDEEFARYLRNRARDLLSNDYESGDAAWITGHFKNLNAQIGSYEVYDDELYGVKTFFSFSLLSNRRQETTALRQAMRGLQALEDSLPYENHKKIREDIPVGVYDVVADFGQSRGGNTATILPNESYLARRYGRTILLRANIMREPNIFQGTSRTWEAAIATEHKDDLSADGNFYRTLWHEVGHYLGVDRTKDGRDLDEALQEDSSAMEEMKADLVSLFVAPALRKNDYYTDAQLRSVYASGILRVLQNNKPRRDQPYNTMQLMQWNFFLENRLLSFEQGKLQIDYAKYHDVVGKLLRQVLEVQYLGDKAAADRFIEQYTKWDDNLHGAIARNIRDQQRYRFRLFKYAALGE
ncbi:MAG: zincin-like metallopeptidase domain-containing protein [Pyrinomonadaceae bacterium]|nr:zincin-like metallopeptidase domain-containing protein [Pyrinomonadaceae bacterium]